MNWSRFKKNTLPFLVVMAFLIALISFEVQKSYRLAQPYFEIYKKFAPNVERHTTLYQEIVSAPKGTPTFAPSEYRGKIAFFAYKALKKSGQPVLDYCCVQRYASDESKKKYSNMIASTPEETEIIVVFQLPDDWTMLDELPHNVTLTAIHVPSRKLMAQIFLTGQTSSKWAFPSPGINYVRQGDSLFSRTYLDTVKWQQVLTEVATATHWDTIHLK